MLDHSSVAEAVVRICGALMTKALAGGLLAFARSETIAAGAATPTQGSQVCVRRREAARAWLFHA